MAVGTIAAAADKLDALLGAAEGTKLSLHQFSVEVTDVGRWPAVTITSPDPHGLYKMNERIGIEKVTVSEGNSYYIDSTPRNLYPTDEAPRPLPFIITIGATGELKLLYFTQEIEGIFRVRAFIPELCKLLEERGIDTTNLCQVNSCRINGDKGDPCLSVSFQCLEPGNGLKPEQIAFLQRLTAFKGVPVKVFDYGVSLESMEIRRAA